jgi:thymidylate synthase (FAD)
MIELLEHAGSDNSIANTARVSMQFKANWKGLPENYSEEQRDKLIGYLARNKHTSPFRHTSITVRMDVPIFLARQLGKHQIGMSWNEVSRRYVATEPTFHYPNEWRERPAGSIKQGSAGVHPDNEVVKLKYDNVIKQCLGYYNELLDRGVAPEQARMVLPQSMMTQVIWTGSLTAFAHVYNLRADSHAQVEAQEFAHKLDEVICLIFPVAWKTLTNQCTQ